jgi:hypothetical protein
VQAAAAVDRTEAVSGTPVEKGWSASWMKMGAQGEIFNFLKARFPER